MATTKADLLARLRAKAQAKQKAKTTPRSERIAALFDLLPHQFTEEDWR